MEEKTDKVVGYIEYLGAGGMIGEIVPYTSVEKFKDEILDSLDCGRPVTPVVFSDELDEPLQFDSDTYFPWGFRSKSECKSLMKSIKLTGETLFLWSILLRGSLPEQRTTNSCTRGRWSVGKRWTAFIHGIIGMTVQTPKLCVPSLSAILL